MSNLIPIALFAYARPQHLARTLASLRANRVPLIYAFSDAPKDASKEAGVAQVRAMLRAIDWCDVVLIERAENWGTGRSILAGVTHVLENHNAVLVFEDDLTCVPGGYEYLCAALEHYRDTRNVMSVTGWTHPRVTPTNVSTLPYFDGRAECLAWGTWRRAWQGMDVDAPTLVQQCRARGIDIFKYGKDLPAMAEMEAPQNLWAVRWLYHHILRGGLCLRPPYSLVEHIGFDAQATRATEAGIWADKPPATCPPIPQEWIPAIENEQCAGLWRKAVSAQPTLPRRVINKLRRLVSSQRQGKPV